MTQLKDLSQELQLKIFGMAINSCFDSRTTPHDLQTRVSLVNLPSRVLEPMITRICLGFNGIFSKDFLFDGYFSNNQVTVELKAVTRNGQTHRCVLYRGTLEEHPEFGSRVRSLMIGTCGIWDRASCDTFVRMVESILAKCGRLGRLSICLANVQRHAVKRV